MTSVNIADLKARLSEHLRTVRRGHTLTVLDRNTPIARIVPYEAGEPLRVREPKRRYRALKDIPFPPRLRLDVDVVDLLLEERQINR